MSHLERQDMTTVPLETNNGDFIEFSCPQHPQFLRYVRNEDALYCAMLMHWREFHAPKTDRRKQSEAMLEDASQAR